MSQTSISHSRSVLVFVIALSLILTAASLTAPFASVSRASTPELRNKSRKAENAKTSAAPDKIGRPILWGEPGEVPKLDLYLGIGSEQGMPKPPFQFKKEDTTGTNPKIKVIDANGVKWNIKFDEEVHAEVAASRLVWACGYKVEESYFVPSGHVNGVTGLGRARKFIKADGSFKDGMFEKRPNDVARRKDPWSWSSNPFTGTKELSGLIMLNALVNNWDSKQSNNAIFGKYDHDGSVVEWYAVADWGGSFGKMGSLFSHSKWRLDDFAKQRFISEVSNNTVKLNYSGKMSVGHSVPLEHARWFAGIVGQLTDTQLQDAFRAAGASQAEVAGFASVVRRKIDELKSAVGR